ncbi:hypothetical protein [Desulfosporosinus acididurans]|nr:hypothetical protein [Desulfosporosinus acididurans]
MGNKEFWNNRFSKKEDKLLSPEKSLIESIKFFKKGSVLDIACGDGRNALFLIENGFNLVRQEVPHLLAFHTRDSESEGGG